MYGYAFVVVIKYLLVLFTKLLIITFIILFYSNNIIFELCKKEIWDAIHAAAESDTELAKTILDSVGVVVHKPVCYDEIGYL
ncbi:putative DC-UbP/UBTD2 domain superfamily protein [Helianthus annuus]|uniref:DC-UbP/UBTD2 domain superfamily protein n=1 Tax=Helianthus annuus TaxID=4232 RepID=A0A251SDA9_HELAN|nr:putative DC-UbP/UBTD2 domain superfamily protein [Helianthus annuus]KAJ0452912.1 putative Ubiquitin domain-containing protein [Helianthus annuus]KAJ0474827.1 putative Ubiquitin domain-containing protein [Helianthus annuus]KAJ0650382.1 putative Ubiquitin domain-containing protein [Helianthus annuus]KAJ0654148.1 putative Ubiquitin domain-containing protein [Helianthus annuus]